MKMRTSGMVVLIAVLAFPLRDAAASYRLQKGETSAPKPPEEKKMAAPEEKKEVVLPPLARAAY